MRPSYPVLLIPSQIQQHRLLPLAAPSSPKPIPPTEPRKPTPPKPLESAPQLTSPGLLVFFIFLSVLMGGGLSVVSMAAGITIGVLLSGISLWLWKQWRQSSAEELAEYQKRQALLSQKLRQYRQRLPVYNQQYFLWQQQRQSYEQTAAVYEAEVAQIYQQAEPARQYLRQVLSYTKHPDGTKQGKAGISESRFALYLHIYFPGKISTNKTLTLYSAYPYIPDFIYYDSNWNLLIDIEIDEPYAYHNLKPTHYLGLDKEDNRNAFFLRQGWVVVRLAEEQVVCFPESCCHFISNVVNYITGEPIPEKLANVPEITLIPRWTMTAAQDMANQGYRERYLP